MMATSTTKLFPRYTGDDIPVIKLPNKKSTSLHEWNASKSSLLSQQSMSETTFWLDNPSLLIETFDILPQDNMSDAERLNAMTRAVIIISAIMFLLQFQLWWLFLIFGLILIIALWQFLKERIKLATRREYLRRPIIKPIKKRIIEPLNNHGQLNIISRY